MFLEIGLDTNPDKHSANWAPRSRQKQQKVCVEEPSVVTK